MKILVKTAGSYRNKGDAAIVISMLDCIYAKYPDVEVDITGNIDSYIAAKRESSLWSKPIKFVNLPSFIVLGALKSHLVPHRCKRSPSPIGLGMPPCTPSKKPQAHSLYLRALRSYLMLLDSFLASILPKKLFVKSCAGFYSGMGADFLSYDGIILGGGTQFEDKEYRGYPGFASNLSILAAACAARIPFFVSGQSVGPIKSSMGQMVTRHLLRRAAGICLREENSKRYVKENLHIHRTIEVGSDWAFLLNPAKPENVRQLVHQSFANPGKPRIAVIPRKIALKDCNFSLHEVARAADKLLEQDATELVLFPQTIDPASLLHDDYQTCVELKKLMKRKVPIIDTRDWTVGEISGFLGSLDLLITFRMHAIIMAAAAGGTPAIAISHIHKFDGIMEQLGLPDLIIRNENLSADEIVAKALFVFDHVQVVRSRLSQGIPRVKKMAQMNLLHLADILGSTHSA